MGRFISPDPLLASAKMASPQTWNRYVYALNSPFLFVDPSGLIWGRIGDGNVIWYENEAALKKAGATEWTQLTYGIGNDKFVTLSKDGPNPNGASQAAIQGWSVFTQASMGAASQEGREALAVAADPPSDINIGDSALEMMNFIGAVGVVRNAATSIVAKEGLGIVGTIRAALNIGKKRNIAYAEVEAGSISERLVGVSGEAARAGTVGVPGARVFEATVAGGFERSLDSEIKILEEVGRRLGNNTEVRGTVRLFSERPVCSSCDGVINQFRQRYPNVQVVVSSGPPPQ